MPAVGDQHNSGPANPFQEETPRISEYTAIEIATLQSRLQKQLGPEYISSRKGPGGKSVNYIASDKVIGLANEVFGFNGWSSTIRDVTIDFLDENPQTHKFDIGLSVIVRITLKDGTWHEDIGYGHMENCGVKAAAFEKAKKEGTTDALKRTLRTFGNVLGNCVYDKDYLNRVTKLKVVPTRFDENKLHRHAGYATPGEKQPVQRTANAVEEAALAMERSVVAQPASRRNSITADGEDDFGSADFDAADFSFADLDLPDEMVLDPPKQPVSAPPKNILPQNQAAPPRPPAAAMNGQSRPQSVQQNSATPRPQLNTAGQPSMQSRPQSNYLAQQNRAGGPVGRAGPQTAQDRPGQAPQIPQNVQRQPNGQAQAQAQAQRPPVQQPPPHHVAPPPPAPLLEQPVPPGIPTGFLSAKAAATAQNGASATAQLPKFDPKAESPSIRKTVGVDHTKSMSIKRAQVLGPEQSRTNQADMGRRIGAPAAMPSPLANRGQFRPVGMSAKRPSEGSGQPQNRAVLNDVTATSVNAPSAMASEPDFKRPRLDADGGGPGVIKSNIS